MTKTIRSISGLRGQPSPGTVINERYELTDPLRSGGFGAIWRAIDLHDRSRPVALKFLQRDAQTPAGRAGFSREIRALELLRGKPHTVQILGHNELHSWPYLVLEYICGYSLSEVLESLRHYGQLPPTQDAYAWIDEICQALAAAHRLGPGGPISHGDLNPSNIMLDGAGGRRSIQVLDFGQAVIGSSPVSCGWEASGTPGYRAPELLQARPAHPTPSSDVFALGVLFTELLSLERCGPEGQQLDEFAAQAPGRLRPFLYRRRPEVPIALWNVLATALDPRPSRRPTDAQVLRDELRSCRVLALRTESTVRSPSVSS